MIKAIQVKRGIEKVKKTNRFLLAVVALAIIALLGFGIVAAYPFFGLFENGSETHKAIKNAIENGDYDSWRSLMEEGLSEENFNKIVERQNQFSKRMKAREERMQAIQDALDSGDYDSWSIAVTVDGKTFSITEKVTEDNFATYVKFLEAKQSRDFETAKELATELGFEGKYGYFGHFKGSHFKYKNWGSLKSIPFKFYLF